MVSKIFSSKLVEVSRNFSSKFVKVSCNFAPKFAEFCKSMFLSLGKFVVI